MTKNYKNIVSICGATSIAITVIVYLFTFDNIFTVTMRWLSLMFLILAEVIGTVKALTVKRSIFGVSVLITSIVHIMVVLVCSIVFINIFPLMFKKYILLNLLALCILLVADVVVLFFSNKVMLHNNKLNESQSIMACCIEKAQSLCINFEETAYKKDFQDIVESLKYSDNSCMSQDELTIMNKLDELQHLLSNNEQGIEEKIIEIKNIIKLRSVKVASTKRGSY